MTNESTESDYNHARHELSKVTDAADKYVIKVEGRFYDGVGGGETRGMSLTPEQYAEVKALLISFEL